ncbi:YIP1 family protein [Haloarculaceae archaeon H-GB2-1]|nr:YIP1 family protein [Haloarculaceae archaeon H-GB1-1]MEA5385846.1 YIP1 family protein [Haloarculaceae archaeon H-GB11]MEA5407349.1 YIP1 family protein [Haloarculaceae archaeon H-GB2-1]
MTQWVRNPTGGRDRGPVALARAWFEILTRPRRFFRAAIAPGDQAPGLVFLATVVAIAVGSRFVLVPGSYPVVGGRPVASALLWLALLVLLAAPAALHLTAALQTLLLLAFVDDRAGVSQTVQVIAYATAPCVVAGIPIPGLRLACCVYGTVLLAIGMAEVHDVPLVQASVLVAVPAALVFGYAFGGFAAAETVGETVARTLDRRFDVDVTVGF